MKSPESGGPEARPPFEPVIRYAPAAEIKIYGVSESDLESLANGSPNSVFELMVGAIACQPDDSGYPTNDKNRVGLYLCNLCCCGRRVFYSGFSFCGIMVA